MQMESQEEAETEAWMEHKMTKASDWLQVVALKESIIKKAWGRWEDGLRLAHKQRKIGEATVRMKTTSEQLILVLKLTEDEHK